MADVSLTPEPQPVALPEGVTQEGATTRVIAERPAPIDAKTEARPEGLPEGFDSWEAYAKSRIEADGKAPEAQAPKVEDKPADPPKEPTFAEQKALIDGAVSQTLEGVTDEMKPKVEPFVRSFAENGTLTDAEVKSAAEATGLSEVIIRQFMKGAETDALKAQLEGITTAQATEAANKPIIDLFGGVEGWNKFNAWTSTGLTEAQAKAFNDAAKTSPEAALELAKTYHTLWAAAGNDSPKDLTNNATNTEAGTDAFATEQEWKSAMADPRYERDAKYRDGVIAKLGRSPALLG